MTAARGSFDLVSAFLPVFVKNQKEKKDDEGTCTPSTETFVVRPPPEIGCAQRNVTKLNDARRDRSEISRSDEDVSLE